MLWVFLPSRRLSGTRGRDRDVAVSPSFLLIFVLKEVMDFMPPLWDFLPSMRLGQARGRVLGVALSPPFGVEITLCTFFCGETENPPAKLPAGFPGGWRRSGPGGAAGRAWAVAEAYLRSPLTS